MTGGRRVRCEDVAKLLPAAVEHNAAVERSVQRHIETCLRCQAELARYRRMLRGLQLLRTRYLEPAPGLLAQTLAAIEAAGERQAVRSVLSGRRLAYAGAIGGAAFAATAATAAMLVHRSRRRTIVAG
jgi:anti-sigma factor RsiW